MGRGLGGRAWEGWEPTLLRSKFRLVQTPRASLVIGNAAKLNPLVKRDEYRIEMTPVFFFFFYCLPEHNICVDTIKGPLLIHVLN